MIKTFLAICGVIGVMATVGTYEATYTRETTCAYIKNDIYTFIDKQGNMWEWEKEPDDNFIINETYILTMDSCHSSTIYDDWIKKIEKQG